MSPKQMSTKALNGHDIVYNVCGIGVFQNAVAKGVSNISFGDLLGNLGTTMWASWVQLCLQDICFMNVKQWVDHVIERNTNVVQHIFYRFLFFSFPFFFLETNTLAGNC